LLDEVMVEVVSLSFWDRLSSLYCCHIIIRSDFRGTMCPEVV
jgi:hypothetical protein